MSDFNSSDWDAFFRDHGLSEQLTTQYLDYAQNLLSQGLPPVFEIEHLSLLLNCPLSELAKMIFSPHSFYRTFEIPKRMGGKRRIEAPYPSLASCQRWILANILYKLPIHPNAHGFSPNRSILSNASPHLAKKTLLKIDLKDFFPSIPINWIIKLFSEIGYSYNVSFFLASLCSLDGKLPQGAATSPAISNLLSFTLDKRLSALSEKFHSTYTRYADDLTFSGPYIPHDFIDIVERIVSDVGFSINRKKTRLTIGGGKKIVTGISVSKEAPTIPRGLKRTLRSEFHCIRKFGLISHISSRRIRNPKYLSSLVGKFAFWAFVEPKNSFPSMAKEFLVNLVREIPEENSD